MSKTTKASEPVSEVAPVSVPETANPRLVVRLGRGRTGGTTGLDWMIQRARAQGRNPIVADCARNPTLSTLYGKEATVPPSDAAHDVKEWMGNCVLNPVAEERRSVALDLGGGQDQTLADFMQDTPLLPFCEEYEVTPVAAYFLGPDADDFDHAMAIRRAGFFSPPQVLLFLNEGVLRRTDSVEGAFGPLRDNPDFRSWVGEGARIIYMQNLAHLSDVRRRNMTLTQAAAKKDNPLGLSKAFAVRDWLKRLELEVTEAGAGAWML
jgi:hypothetical protein